MYLFFRLKTNKKSMVKHADSLENFKLKLTKTTQNAGQCSKDYAASSSFIAMDLFSIKMLMHECQT